MGWDGAAWAGGPSTLSSKVWGPTLALLYQLFPCPVFPAPRPAQSSGTVCSGATSALQMDGVTLCTA